jgi:hypothetical protein
MAIILQYNLAGELFVFGNVLEYATLTDGSDSPIYWDSVNSQIKLCLAAGACYAAMDSSGNLLLPGALIENAVFENRGFASGVFAEADCVRINLQAVTVIEFRADGAYIKGNRYENAERQLF